MLRSVIGKSNLPSFGQKSEGVFEGELICIPNKQNMVIRTEDRAIMLGKPGRPQLMKALNRATVIDILAKRGSVSQTQICGLTGLSRATVSNLINALKQEDLVLEVSKGASKGGRRQVLLQLNKQAGFVVGVDLGGTKMAGAVTDLGGEPLLKLRWPTKADQGPDVVLDNLAMFIQELITQAPVDPGKVRGVGVGVPGIVTNGDVVDWAPALKWRNLALTERLAATLHYPIFVENDVNLLALGEYWYGSAQGAQSLACLAVGTGLGAGIVLNGQLYKGANGAAGEVCNLVADPSYLGHKYKGFGWLEQFASGPALAQRFSRENGLIGRDSAVNDLDAEYVFEQARLGDPRAWRAVEDFTRYLAMSVVSIATVLDPEVIVLGGGVSQSADLFHDRLVELCAPVLQVMPRLEVSSLGVDAGVMGAVALTLHNTSENPLR